MLNHRWDPPTPFTFYRDRDRDRPGPGDEPGQVLRQCLFVHKDQAAEVRKVLLDGNVVFQDDEPIPPAFIEESPDIRLFKFWPDTEDDELDRIEQLLADA